MNKIIDHEICLRNYSQILLSEIIDDISYEDNCLKIVNILLNSGYGFIKMLNEDDAENAMINLHGKQFHGRPLKVKWSERNARKDDPISIAENDRKNSVHVKFSSTNVRSLPIFCLPIC